MYFEIVVIIVEIALPCQRMTLSGFGIKTRGNKNFS